jgi:hypothetical protein
MMAALLQCFQWDDGDAVDMAEGVGLTMATPSAAVCVSLASSIREEKRDRKNRNIQRTTEECFIGEEEDPVFSVTTLIPLLCSLSKLYTNS